MYICIYRFWPTYLAEPVRPPPEVARAMKIFVNFYTDTGRHSNRKLHWVHSLSSMVITGLFEEKRVDLQVRQSTFEFEFQFQFKLNTFMNSMRAEGCSVLTYIIIFHVCFTFHACARVCPAGEFSAGVYPPLLQPTGGGLLAAGPG